MIPIRNALPFPALGLMVIVSGAPLLSIPAQAATMGAMPRETVEQWRWPDTSARPSLEGALVAHSSEESQSAKLALPLTSIIDSTRMRSDYQVISSCEIDFLSCRDSICLGNIAHNFWNTSFDSERDRDTGLFLFNCAGSDLFDSSEASQAEGLGRVDSAPRLNTLQHILIIVICILGLFSEKYSRLRRH
jgi:hypothetical protein